MRATGLDNILKASVRQMATKNQPCKKVNITSVYKIIAHIFYVYYSSVGSPSDA